MSSIRQKSEARENASEAKSATPMMAQYLEVKAKHPEFLLFYRMGDFFELFFDDAVAAANALGIQLTKRGKHSGEDVPMCGVPVARADDYLQKLIRKGFRVAVAEQLEGPGARQKARAESRRAPRCGAARYARNAYRGCAPRFRQQQLSCCARAKWQGRGGALQHRRARHLYRRVPSQRSGAPDLAGELLRLRPAELLLPDDETADEAAKAASEAASASLSPLPRAYFTKQKGERALKEAFEAAAIEGFGDFSDSDLAAIGALLHYVNLTQMGERPALQAPKTRGPGRAPLHRRRHAREPRTGAAEKRGRADRLLRHRPHRHGGGRARSS